MGHNIGLHQPAKGPAASELGVEAVEEVRFVAVGDSNESHLW